MVKVQVIQGLWFTPVFGVSDCQLIDSRGFTPYFIETKRFVVDVTVLFTTESAQGTGHREPGAGHAAKRKSPHVAGFFFFYSISSEYHIERKTGPTMLA